MKRWLIIDVCDQYSALVTAKSKDAAITLYCEERGIDPAELEREEVAATEIDLRRKFIELVAW